MESYIFTYTNETDVRQTALRKDPLYEQVLISTTFNVRFFADIFLPKNYKAKMN